MNPRNPYPTVDAIIRVSPREIVLIERKNPPFGWAFPGGFVNYGESLTDAVIREAKEETCLDITLTGLLGAFSNPTRDSRQHNMTVVYTAVAFDRSTLKPADDAVNIGVFDIFHELPTLCFDHGLILNRFITQLIDLGY